MCDTQKELSTRADTSQCQSTHPGVTQLCLPAPPYGCKELKEQICLPVSFTLLGVGVKHNNPHLPLKLLLQGFLQRLPVQQFWQSPCSSE